MTQTERNGEQVSSPVSPEESTKPPAEMDDNPYVGPRSFRYEQSTIFKGRERETSELGALLAARRLVLFYAESGAGKTSLLNAGLRPLLEEWGFEVLPVARVAGATPDDFNPVNGYAYNVMAYIDGDKERGCERLTSEHAKLALSDFLLDLVEVDGRFVYAGDEAGLLAADGDAAGGQSVEIPRRALIIDQFEELFTTYSGVNPREAREGFLQQLNKAMTADPYLYVLLSMRADYDHYLTQFVHLLPDKLDTRYYMSRMQRKEAQQAVEEPVANKRPFAPGVAEELVDYLARQRRDEGVEGGEQWMAGDTVEPVQLQVVCTQLWKSLSQAEGAAITRDDLTCVARISAGTELDDEDALAAFVDSALGSYYEQSLQKALRESDADTEEGFLRDWFSHKLITKGGTRGFLPRGAEFTEHVPEAVVAALVEEHILRGETRSGSRWVELVHDSFIEPVRAANEKWLLQAEDQQEWFKLAHEYAHEEDPPESMLLTGDDLAVALNEAGDLDHQPDYVRDFLNASQQLQADKTAASNRRRGYMNIALTVAVIAAVFGIVGALYNLNLADDETVRANEQTIRANEQTVRANGQAEIAIAQTNNANDEKTRADEEAARANRLAYQLIAERLAKVAEDALQEGDYSAAMLLSLAAKQRVTDTAESTLLAALDGIYRRDKINGNFRIETKTPISATATVSGPILLLGTEPGTVVAVLPDGFLVWDPTDAEAESRILPSPGSLMSVSSGGGRVAAVDDRGALYVADDLGQLFAGNPVTRDIRLGTQAEDAAEIVIAFDQDATHLVIASCTSWEEEVTETTVIGDTVDGIEWEFAGQQGDEVTIDLKRLEDTLDPVVELRYEQEVVTRDDDGGDAANSRIIHTLDAPGTYHIVPLSYGDTGGRYELVLSGPDGYTLSGKTRSIDCQLTRFDPDSGGDEAMAAIDDVQGGIKDMTFFDEQTLIWVDGSGNVWERDLGAAATGSLRQLAASSNQHAVAAAMLPDQDVLITAGCLNDTGVCPTSGTGYVQRWTHTESEFTPQGSPLRHEKTLLDALAIDTENGARLVALDADGRTVAWQLDAEKWTQMACEAAGRNLAYYELEEPLNLVLELEEDPEQYLQAESIVCDQFDLHISFALRAAQQCDDLEYAMALARKSSPEALDGFPQEALELTFARILDYHAGEDRLDIGLEQKCIKQSIAIMKETALPGDDVPQEIVLRDQLIRLANLAQGNDPDSAADGALDGILEEVQNWPEASVNALFAASDVLDSACPLDHRGETIDLAIDDCQRLFEVVGQPWELTDDGVPVSGHTNNRQPLWTFSAEEDEFILISMNRQDTTIDPYLELLDEEGTPLSSNDDWGDSRNARIIDQLSGPGPYYIRATTLGETDGRYELSFIRMNAQAWGEDQDSVVADRSAAWYFEADGHEVVSIESNSDEPGLYLELLDEDGNVLSSAGGAGDGLSAQLEYQLSDPGRYYMLASFAGEPAPYELSLAQERPVELAGGGLDGEPASGITRWVLDLQAFETVDIASAAVDDGVIPRLDLLDAQGNYVASDDNWDYGSEADLVYTPQRPGTFLLKARDDGGAGQYELALERRPPIETAYGQTETGTTDELTHWSFQGQAGDPLAIVMDPLSGDLDAVLTLYDEDGRVIIKQDSPEAEQVEVINTYLTETGQYVVAAESFESTSGDYELELTRHEPQELSLPSERAVEPFSAWIFSGEADQLVRLELLADGDYEPDDDNALNIMSLTRPDGATTPRSQSEMVLALDGSEPYTIAIDGDTEVPLRLAATDVSVALLGKMAYGSTVPAQVLEGGSVYWFFDGEVESVVSVALSDLRGPVEVKLFGPDGRLLGQEVNEDTDSLELVSAIPLAGPYVVAVRPQDETAAGLFNLTLEETDTIPIVQECGMSNAEADYGPIDIGSLVKLGEHTPDPINGTILWNETDMPQYVGLTATVTQFAGVDDSGCPWVHVDLDDGEFYWRIRNMEMVQP